MMNLFKKQQNKTGAELFKEMGLRVPLPGPATDLLGNLQQFINYSEIRRLVDRFHVLCEQKSMRAVAVLSQFPAEGKTLAIASLAVATARSYRKKVLLVDASSDYQSATSTLMTLEAAFEPDELKPRSQGVPGALPTLEPGVDLLRLRNVDLVKPDTAKIVEQAQGHYDLVIFDTCALSLRNRNNVDPYLIARHAGAAMLVVSQGARNTQSSMLASVVKSVGQDLERAQVNLVAVLANEGFGYANKQ